MFIKLVGNLLLRIKALFDKEQYSLISENNLNPYFFSSNNREIESELIAEFFNNHYRHSVLYLDNLITVFSCLHGNISMEIKPTDFEQIKALTSLGSPFMYLNKHNDKYLLTTTLESWRYGIKIDNFTLSHTGFNSD